MRIHIQQGQPATSDLGQQIRDQVRAQVDQARKEAQQARLQAQQAAREAQLQAQQVPTPPDVPQPVIVTPPGGGPDTIPQQAVEISVFFFIIVALIIIFLPMARAYARRLDRKAAQPEIGPELKDQLTRIEQAVDAMAIEVERISEAQRYMAKLHSDQTERAGLPRG